MVSRSSSALLTCPRCSDILEPEMVGIDAGDLPDIGPYRSSAAPIKSNGMACEIDRCPRCGGVWFDSGELARTLRELVPEDLGVDGAGSGVDPPRALVDSRMACLRCNVAMGVVRSRAAPWLVYDRCYGCSGIWIDGEDLDRVRDPLVAILALASGEFS